MGVDCTAFQRVLGSRKFDTNGTIASSGNENMGTVARNTNPFAPKSEGLGTVASNGIENMGTVAFNKPDTAAMNRLNSMASLFTSLGDSGFDTFEHQGASLNAFSSGSSGSFSGSSSASAAV